MNDSTRILVDRQIARVWRRLFLQVALDSVLLGSAVGLALAMFWFLVRPFAFPNLDDTLRWVVPGGLFGLGVFAGLGLAWLRRPTPVASSLALDERFGLKERVTTFLTLPPETLDTPAGQALLSDVTTRLAAVKIAGAFPLSVSWKQALLPGGAFALALLAGLADPYLGEIRFSSRSLADQPPVLLDAKEIQKKLDALKEQIQKRNQDDQGKSEELKELEKEFEKLFKEQIDGKNEQKVREQLDKMQKLEDKMSDRLDALREKAEKIDALKKQLQRLGLDPDKAAKDGPAKDFEDALKNGNLEKAKAALEKMVKDLKNDKLNPKERKQLAERFKKLQDKMEKLMNNDERVKQLKKDLKDGKITKKDLEREMERFQELKDLTDLVGDAKDALDGAGKEGAERVEKLLKRFEKMELTDKEIGDLLRDQDELANARDLLMQAMNGDEFGDGEEGNGMGGGKFPGGRRPIAKKDPDGKVSPQRSRANASPKGMQRITGYARGGTFSKIPAKAVEGAFRQAVQNAPEALDRQRIPEDARDIATKYFDKLGNQK
ncbi:MAG: hypothetical protein HYX68_00290 [Planctomycetes bacterium]|nr:hypothetical protein [Planctomycetota bacterium]